MARVDGLDDLVGRRVTVRHRLRSGLLTDAVGELSVDDGEFAVQTRRGPVRVSRADVVAVRAIPPPVPRRPSWAAVARLENVCADAWPARVDRPLGAWRLRAAGGFTGRANAALAVGDPGDPGAGRAGRRPRLRRRARRAAAGARADGVAVGPGRGHRRLGARRRA